VVFEQYHIQECIGEGRVSVVWRAVDDDTDAEVALKLYTQAVVHQRSRDAQAIPPSKHHPPNNVVR